MLKYFHMCALIAARWCYDDGQSVKRIARSAKKHPSTIYRWLRVTRRY